MPTDDENRDIDPKPQRLERPKRLYRLGPGSRDPLLRARLVLGREPGSGYSEGRDDRMVQALPGSRRPAVRRSAHRVLLPHADSAADRRDELRLQESRRACDSPRPALAPERDDRRPRPLRAGRLGRPQVLGDAARDHQPVLLRRRLRPRAAARPRAFLGPRSAQERTARPEPVLRDPRRARR